MKYKDLFKLLHQDGWYTVRQKGSHVIMRHPTKQSQLTVPNHTSKEVKTGLLRSILKKSDIQTNKG